MWIYWTVILISFFFYPLCTIYRRRKNNISVDCAVGNEQIKAYFVIVAAVMIIVIGLRENHIGTDTISYYNTYRSMANREFSYLFEQSLDEEGREKGFVFIQILFNKLKISFTGFNIIYAIFNIWVITLFIYKKSTIPWLSYFLYIAFGMFVLDLTMMRQTTAMSIVILAVLYDKNENIYDFIKFAVIVYAASLIHSSAIICIPIWFVFKIPYNKKTLIGALCIIALTYIMKSFMVNIVSQIANDISNKYENAALLMSEGNAGMRQYAMILVTILMGAYLKKFINEPFNLKLHYMLIIMLIVFPAVQGGGAFMRVYYYFYVFMIVYVPNMINSIDRKKDRLIYIITMGLYIVVGTSMYVSSILGNSYNMVPYKFFWQ